MWSGLIDILALQLKNSLGLARDKLMESVSRLLWTYLFRCSDTPSSKVLKRLELFRKSFFTNQTLIGGENVLIKMVYYILCKYPEWGNEEYIQYLLTEPPLASESIVNSERLYIAFSAFFLVLRDVEETITRGGVVTMGAVSRVESSVGSVVVESKVTLPIPSFPTFGDADLTTFFFKAKKGNNGDSNEASLVEDQIGSSMKETLKLVNSVIGQVWKRLDISIGYQLFDYVVAERTIITGGGHSTSASGSINIGRVNGTAESMNSFTGIPSRVEVPEDRNIDLVNFKLLRTMIDCFPRLNPTGLECIGVMLSRYTLHLDESLQERSFAALCRIAKDGAAISTYEIFVSSTSSLIYDRYNDFWLCGSKFQEVLLTLAKRKLLLIEICLSETANDKIILEILDSTGLYYICSAGPELRKVGVQMLALAERRKIKTHVSVYEIITANGFAIIKENTNFPIEALKLSYLSKMETPLLTIMQSVNEQDIEIWNNCYPSFLKWVEQMADPSSVMGAINLMWIFLKPTQLILNGLSGEMLHHRNGFLPILKRAARPIGVSAPDSLLNLLSSWKTYISFSYACIGVAKRENLPLPATDIKSYGVQTLKELNRNVLPLLSSENSDIRIAAVTSIRCAKLSTVSTILEDIQPFLSGIVADFQNRAKKVTAITENAFERMRGQLSNLLACISKLENFKFHFNTNKAMAAYISVMITHLSDSEIQMEWTHIDTRINFCIFIENYYRSLIDFAVNGEDFTFQFETRKQLLLLFGGWCGYGLDGEKSRKREAAMMASALDSIKDINERGFTAKKMDAQRKANQLASLKAIASLCKGPLTDPRSESNSLDLTRLISWLNSLLESPQLQFHRIARSAIESIITLNLHDAILFERILENCYSITCSSNVTIGYFLGLVDVLTLKPLKSSGIGIEKLVCLGLLHLGNTNSMLRRGANRLVYALGEAGQGDGHQLSSMCLSSDVFPVYKAAQLNSSLWLATEFKGLAVHVLSEITTRLKSFSATDLNYRWKCQSLLAVLSPWLSDVPLSGSFSILNSGKDRDHDSLVILQNLFWISSQFNDSNPLEIQNLWISVAESKNRKISFPQRQEETIRRFLIFVDFLALSIIKFQDQKYLITAKTIMVYLSRSEFGGLLFGLVVERLKPSSMSKISQSVLDNSRLQRTNQSSLYMAHIDCSPSFITNSYKPSLCILYISLLVDINFDSEQRSAAHLATLLTIIFGQMDSTIEISEDMRTLLINLMQPYNKKDVKIPAIHALKVWKEFLT